MTIFINPGSGPVAGASEPAAMFAMGFFTGEMIRERGYSVRGCERLPDADDAGRFGFRLDLEHEGRAWSHEIDMPGLPLERVRWMDEADQNIWDFPRLCVDGSSWAWLHALAACAPPDGSED